LKQKIPKAIRVREASVPHHGFLSEQYKCELSLSQLARGLNVVQVSFVVFSEFPLDEF
jgi:hypothetical protein